MNTVLLFASTFLVFTITLYLVKAVSIKNTADRIIAINAIGTKTVVLISFVSYFFEQRFFLDVALVYALINFLSTVYLSRIIITRQVKDGVKLD